MDVSLQLFTLRNESQHDFTGTLKKVADIGYKGVEFAGYGNLSAGELKKNLDKFHLKASGSHVGMDQLESSLDSVIEYNIEIGNKYIVCPCANYNSKQDFLDMTVKLNKIGQKCKDKGLQLCYHNHAHEFKVYDGTYGLDILYSETDPDLVKAEFDVYWIQYAGINPVDYIKKHRDRCELIHLKDMAKDRTFAEVGNGTMDIKSIIETSKECGAKCFIVEQDECKRPPFESVKMSFDYLNVL